MHLITQSSIHTLSKSKTLVSSISDENLSNHSVPPYYSCIGSHLRHILDFYDCILEGLESEKIDLTNRKRDERMHSDTNYAISNVDRVIKRLSKIDNYFLSKFYVVCDDLGMGKVEITYTLGAILAQANSHAIHHYAIINYILDSLGITIDDETFGYNPTTPKQEINLN